MTAKFEIAARPVERPTVVSQIYPSTDRLPENQLKFYLHFSAPMSRGQAYEHIRLIDETGKTIEGAFLELEQELWDRDLRRFTLLCDPGRVKRGLKPREELGPVLEEGKNYTLVIERGWRDANGMPLEADARKSFGVSSPDETRIDIADWKIAAPHAGTTEPLVVRFPEPLDHSLLERVVSIADAVGNEVAGTIRVEDHETSWHFVPELPWASGDYRLITATTLEDLAGNSIGRAFEVDTSQSNPRSSLPDTVSLQFTITSADSE